MSSMSIVSHVHNPLNLDLSIASRTPSINGRKAKRLSRTNSVDGGFSRDIYVLGEYIIKISEKTGCLPQSQTEYERWFKIDEADKPFFAEMLAYFETKTLAIIVQKYYKLKRITEQNTPANMLSSKYHMWDVSEGYNCGITPEGQLIIYDYAC